MSVFIGDAWKRKSQMTPDVEFVGVTDVTHHQGRRVELLLLTGRFVTISVALFSSRFDMAGCIVIMAGMVTFMLRPQEGCGETEEEDQELTC